MEMINFKETVANNDFVVENLPDPERVIEGLRDTGYDLNTAMADIIDNSIAANADIIKVTTNISPSNEITIYIADNGCGMDFEELCNAMKYGSNRRIDPHSLGKFGLGLKTASTAFCRKLSLVSRGKDNILRKVQWDLDFVGQNGWKLKVLTPTEDEEELLYQAAGDKTGTLVVWESIDRILKGKLNKDTNKTKVNKMLDKIVNDLKFHFSMVYQRFLDTKFDNVPSVNIFVNDALLTPWDPFCTAEPNSEKLAEQEILVEKTDGTTSKFKLAAYAIPRKDGYSTNEARDNGKNGIDYMGFYIYRENRLIHFGDWLKMFTKDPHDSLLRVDFSFDYTLDEAFNVDVKKSKVALNEDIYNYIRDKFLPAAKRHAEQKYRGEVAQKIDDNTKNGHEASNKTINSKAPGLEGAKVTVTNPEKGEVEIENDQGKFVGVLRVEAATKDGECRVIPKKMESSTFLWEAGLVDGKHAVFINENHPYYQKVYYPNRHRNDLIVGMDSLLWALAETELSLYTDELKDSFDDVRYNVSKKIKKLIEDLPEPDLSEE